MSKKLGKDFQKASTKQLQDTSSETSPKNVIKSTLSSEKTNCQLCDSSCYTKPHSSNKYPEQSMYFYHSKFAEMTPNSVQGCLESFDQCKSSVKSNVKTGTKQKLKLSDEIQQTPKTPITRNSEALDYNIGMTSSHSYVSSKSNKPAQLNVVKSNQDVDLSSVTANSQFQFNEMKQFNLFSQIYAKDQSPLPLMEPTQESENIGAKNLADVNDLLNQLDVNKPSYPPNHNFHSYPPCTSQNQSDLVNTKPTTNSDICWPISEVMPPFSKQEINFSQILSQQKIKEQQKTDDRRHHCRKRHRIPNTVTCKKFITARCPPSWMYIRIPKSEDVVRMKFKDFRDLATSIDSDIYSKTNKQFEEIPIIFE